MVYHSSADINSKRGDVMAKREYTEHQRKQNQKWRKKNADKVKQYRSKYRESGQAKSAQYRHRYGVSSEQIEAIKIAQKYICPACGEPFGNAVTAIDHCHLTGKVRAVLHRQCNSMIGLAKESAETLERAAIYLRSNS